MSKSQQQFIYAITMVKGHLIATIDNINCLIDTGAPVSFGNIAHVTIANTAYTFPKQYMTFSTQLLTQFIGYPIDNLIGMDVLGMYCVTYSDTQLVLNTQVNHVPANVAVAFDSNFLMGIAMIPVHIKEANEVVFFDTGAWLSYYHDESYMKQHCTLENAAAQDFHPSIGTFTTPSYKVPVTCTSNTQLNLSCGILPKELQHMMLGGQVKGIIGSQVLDDYDVVISVKAKKVYFVHKE